MAEQLPSFCVCVLIIFTHYITYVLYQTQSLRTTSTALQHTIIYRLQDHFIYLFLMPWRYEVPKPHSQTVALLNDGLPAIISTSVTSDQSKNPNFKLKLAPKK